jgi:hypothetical protein
LRINLVENKGMPRPESPPEIITHPVGKFALPDDFIEAGSHGKWNLFMTGHLFVL